MTNFSLPPSVRQPESYELGDARPVGPLPHGVPVGHTQEVELRQYWRVVQKYRVLITAILVASLAIATIYAFTTTPRYTAKAVIRIGSYMPVLAATKVEDLLEQKSKESDYLETQIQEIRSYSLADLVLQDPVIKAGFAKVRSGFLSGIFSGDPSPEEEHFDQVSGYKAPIDLIKRYMDLVNVAPVRRTSLVNIEVTHEDPAFAAIAANKHANAYIDWVRQTRVEQQGRGVAFLTQQAGELREKVADTERQMADYAEANSIVAVNKDENIVAQKMSQLNRLLSESMAREIEANNAHAEAHRTLDSDSAAFDDGSLQQLRAKLGELQAERAEMAQKFNPGYPKMIQLASQIEQITKSIKEQRTQIVNGLAAKAAAATNEVKNLREELEKQKSQAFELSKRQVHYNALDRELQSSRELLTNVLKQIKETSLSVESNASNVVIVDKAVTPASPTYPRKKLVLMLGLLFGVFAGVGAALLLDYLDNTVRTPDDIEQMIKLPSLGVIPTFTAETVKISNWMRALPSAETGAAAASSAANKEDSTTASTTEGARVPMLAPTPQVPVYLLDNRSLVAEAFRTLRTNITLSQAGHAPRRILITSALSSEGKTSCSVNLAAALASTGSTVCLVDVDLRRPSVNKHFKITSRAKGVVDVLTGQAFLDDTLLPTPIEGVTILPSGAIPPNPTELIGSREMGDLLEILAERYDHVIVDSAPLLPVIDSVIISRLVDGVVLVVKGASTPARAVNDAKQKIASVGSRLLGVVLNDIDIHGQDYYYYNYYYRSYYLEEQDPRDRKRSNAA